MKTINPNTTWYIAGLGAMGSLMAGRFYEGGTAIRLILKNDAQQATYQNTALTVITDENTFTCQPAAINLDQTDNSPIHYLLCCVKAYDVTALLMRLKPRLNERSIIISLHNGLGVLDEIKKQLPQLRTISAISTLGAYLEKPFTVRAFLTGKLALGITIGQFTPEEISAVCAAFHAASLPYQWEEDIQPMLWEKFALNCSINMLTALFNCKNGGLLAHQALLKEITQEVAEVLQTYGVNLSSTDLFLKVIQVIKGTAENYSSMYKDVQHHRKTELLYLNEQLLHLAQQKKIATPHNQKLLKQFYEKFPNQKS